MSGAIKKILIKAVGDVCLAGIEQDPFRFSSGDLEGDLRFCNLECCLTNRPDAVEKNVHFKAPPESASYLKDHGFNLISLANNHVLDYGLEGLRDTLRALDAEGLRYFGAGTNATAAQRALEFEVGGIRVAVIASADAAGGASSGPTISVLGMRSLRKRISRIRRDADLIIASYHGGIELETVPSPFVVRGLRRLVDAGADIILAHHPHVLQPVEMYRNRLIAYSLGNFVFDNSRYGERAQLSSRSAILSVEATFDGDTRKLRNISHTFIPFEVQADFIPRPLEEAKRESFYSFMESLNRSLAEVRTERADVQRIENFAAEIHNKPFGTVIRYGIRHAGDYSLREMTIGVKWIIRKAIRRMLKSKRGGGGSIPPATDSRSSE